MSVSLREVSSKKPPSRTPLISLCAWRSGVRARLYLGAVDQVDWRIEDHALSRAYSCVDLHLRAQVACDPDVADLGLAVLDNRRLQTAAGEDDCFRRNDEGWGLARYLELDRAVDAGRQRTVRIGNIDLGQQRARAALQRVGDPRHLARELAIRKFGHTHDRFDARSNPERRVLRHIDPYPDHVLLHDLEHEGAGIGVALHQRADIDIALRDDPIEWSSHRGIGPVLPQHLEQALLRRGICLRDADCGLVGLDGLQIDIALVTGHPSILEQWLFA